MESRKAGTDTAPKQDASMITVLRVAHVAGRGPQRHSLDSRPMNSVENAMNVTARASTCVRVCVCPSSLRVMQALVSMSRGCGIRGT